MKQSEFLELIHSDAAGPERRICIFAMPGERHWLLDDADAAERFIATLDPACDVYHGMSLVGGSPAGRGTAADMVAFGALWCDVDVASGPHKGNLPPTKDAALELLEGLAIPPSLVVDSGFGLHGYWPLAEPVHFPDPDARLEAARVAKSWHGLVCDAAAKRGWKLQNLGDLPRVLRTPGTRNNKAAGDPRPVTVVRNTGELFDYPRFLELTQTPAPAPAPTLTLAPGVLSALDRCRLYLNEVPPAIQGCAGGAQTLVACKAIFRFGLDGAEARAAFEHYNARCVPPWTSEREIQHKLTDAAKSVDAAGERGKWLETGWVVCDPVGHQAAAAFLGSANGHPAPSPEPPQDDPGFPADCLAVPGLLGDVIAYNLRTAMYPQPELALAGALAMLGAVTAQRIKDWRGTRTNIYTLGIAPSGAGKEHARQVNKNILVAACTDGEKLLGPERIGSHAGIITAVANQTSILFQIDEFGKLLSTMRSASKQPHLYNIASVLLQLYSSSGTVWIGDAYADAKKVKRIIQPHVCIYGSSTPADFWDGLTRENVSEGLLGRLLVLEGGYVDRKDPRDEPVPEGILERVRKWIEFRPPGSGNLGEAAAKPSLAFMAEPNAQRRLDDHLDSICDRRRTEGPVQAAVWSRSGEKTAKLALLFACSRWDGNLAVVPRIDLSDVDRAIRITNWLTRKMLRKAFEHVAENETEHRSKKLLRAIAGEITMSELTRRTQWLRARERAEIVQDLITAGYLETVQRETATKPVTILKKLK